jgi:protein SCO1/2
MRTRESSTLVRPTSGEADVRAADRAERQSANGRGVSRARGVTGAGGRRWRIPLIGLCLAVALGLSVAALWGVFRDEGPTLVGTPLDGQLAPGFTLTDQRGQTIGLHDLHGKAIVLSFIYTNCPDVCPLTAEKLRVAYEGLPESERDRVAFLAVTVDPDRDTAAALQSFSQAHLLADNPSWHALLGDPTALQSVWQAYGIDPGAIIGASGHEHVAEGGGATDAPGSDAGQLAHTDALYVIDPNGRERVLMHSDLDPNDLTANLRAMLA